MSKKPKKTDREKIPRGPIAQPKETALPAISSERSLPGTSWELSAIFLLLVAMVCAIYVQTLGHEFINYDDNFYVYENPAITNGLNFDGILTTFTQKEFGLWNPLVTISHMLDYQLFGLWAGGHHLTNLLLHLASSLLLFFILRRMTGTLWRSALVAALFAIHPLRVESVAWVSERKDVLSGLFFMLTLCSYLHYVRQPKSWRRYGLVLLMFACGLMCKPMLVTLPFLLLLLDYWPLYRLFRDDGRGLNWQAVREKIPLLIMTVGLCVVTMTGNADPHHVDPIPFLTRVGLAPIWLVIYLGQMFWPFRLAIIYTFPEDYFPWWPVALTLFGLLSIGCFLLRKRQPYLWMGWLWNLGMLVPALGFIQISRHSQADHYNYLPQIGLYIGAIWAVAEWTKEWRCPPAMLKIGTAVVLTALMIIAFRQTSTWRDNVTIWNYTLAVTKNNFVVHSNLGYVLAFQNKKEEAVVHFREALRINPSYAEAHTNLGSVLYQLGEKEEGAAHIREALRINPLYPEGHYNMASVLSDQNQPDAAIAEYREVLRINPNIGAAYNKLGLKLLQKGDLSGATSEFKAALEINPDDAEALYNLANILDRQGQIEEAISHLRRSLQINPDSPQAHNNLGAMLRDQGHKEAAVLEYRAALRIKPDYVDALNNLGRVLEEQEKFDDALTEYREALRTSPDDPASHSNLGNLLLRKGETKEGLLHLERALELQPGNPALQNTLAWALATLQQRTFRNGPRALQLAKQANQSTGGKVPLFLRTLAAAYAQTGNFPKAAATIGIALLLAKDQTDLSENLRNDLKWYQSGKTFGGN